VKTARIKPFLAPPTAIMVNITEKIAEIEAEMRRTQKNKATEYHLGLLKGKLARLRAQLLEPTSTSGGPGAGFDVSKSGDARIALVGFPSVGKSTFLSKITKTKSEVAAYSFTTLTAIPGVLEYGGAEIQVLDLPGIIEGAAEGKGRGRQVISAAKVRSFQFCSAFQFRFASSLLANLVVGGLVVVAFCVFGFRTQPDDTRLAI
jgi:ribosome-interacting GTPase 1